MRKGIQVCRDVIDARFGGPAKFLSVHPEFEKETLKAFYRGKVSNVGWVMALLRALDLINMPPQWLGFQDPFKAARR